MHTRIVWKISNQREGSNSESKNENAIFFFFSHDIWLDLKHIPMKFPPDIPYGNLVMVVSTRIVWKKKKGSNSETKKEQSFLFATC